MDKLNAVETELKKAHELIIQHRPDTKMKVREHIEKALEELKCNCNECSKCKGN